MRRLLICTALAFAVPPAAPLWAQATDLVCSQCVDTGDIADGAVTGVKLAPNAVNNSKILNGAVNAAKLSANAVTVAKIANNAVSTPKLSTASVTRPKIAPNAINASKIANAAVTAAKIAPDAVNRFKIADGAVTAAKLGIAHMTFIDDSGNDVANCDALRDALTGLSGPAAVVLAAGTYACGSDPVILNAEVSLIGAARNLVTITGNIAGTEGLVRLQGPDTLLTGVTVVNDPVGAGISNAVIVGAGSVATPGWRIADVTAIALNADAGGMAISVTSSDCDEGEITDVFASSEGDDGDHIGVNYSCGGGTHSAENLRAEAASGSGIDFAVLGLGASTITVRNSRLTGTLSAVNATGSSTVIAASTQLDGLVLNNVLCVGDYDGAGLPLTNGPNSGGGCVTPP